MGKEKTTVADVIAMCEQMVDEAREVTMLNDDAASWHFQFGKICAIQDILVMLEDIEEN